LRPDNAIDTGVMTPEEISAILASFMVCIIAPLASGLFVEAAKYVRISPETLLNCSASVLVISILVGHFIGRRVPANHLQFIDRELGSLNFFKQKVVAHWPDDWTASNTKVVRFLLESIDDVRTEIKCLGEVLNSTHLFEQGELQVIFPAKKSGEYSVSLWVGGREVRSSPWTRYVLPGPPDPPSCRIVGHWATGRGLVVPAGTETNSHLQIKDSFFNTVDCISRDCEDVGIELTSSPESAVNMTTSVTLAQGSEQLRLAATFPSSCSGSYPLRVLYKGHTLITRQVIVLLPASIADIQESLRDLSNYSWNNYYTANLIKLAGVNMIKPKTVYLYLKEKQLIIKEFYLKFIPRKIVSFRVHHKVVLDVTGSGRTLVISQAGIDGSETVLVGHSVLSLAAAFYLTLGKRLGGTQSFKEKREHFYAALVQHHSEKGHKHVRIPLLVNRSIIFDSTLRSTRYFLESDWARLFDVRFDGEPGQDQGGLRREWMELITRFVFDPRNEMFVPLEEEGPGLQPNPFPPPHIKLKHYRLAGKLVGKCLYESSCGKTYRLNLNAQLAKSFLTQIIGIDVPYTLLSVDAPSLYESKVKYILKNPVEDLDLTFTQEETRAGTRVSVELCPGGSTKVVKEENKKEYVNMLAKYLMVDRINKQVQAFIEGVNTLVPAELLTLWDEGELELLLCGIRQYNLQLLKQHHQIIGVQTIRFSRVLMWFWEALSHFSTEDMARFVQFVTGSSLLPPGGWADLSPSLQISLGGDAGNLPTSHTCFNLLVIPPSENYEELERVMLLAVREGSEGFLLA